MRTIAIGGKLAECDERFVKTFLKKEELVEDARQLQNYLKNRARAVHIMELENLFANTMFKIIRINRKIAREGMFVRFV